jgi:hypothetical protein
LLHCAEVNQHNSAILSAAHQIGRFDVSVDDILLVNE